MGDDTPLAVLSRQVPRPASPFFRQNFSQVTNPPIDSLRETRVMTLKTRLGNLGNILDEDPSQSDVLVLESPGAARTPSSRRCATTWATPPAEIDCTFDGRAASPTRCAQAIERIRARGRGGGARGLHRTSFLTDETSAPDRVAHRR